MNNKHCAVCGAPKHSPECCAGPKKTLAVRLVRVRAEWRDWRAGLVYLLEKYIETPPILRIFPWVKKGAWELVTPFTDDLEKAKAWATHYGVEIQFESVLDHQNMSSAAPTSGYSAKC